MSRIRFTSSAEADLLVVQVLHHARDIDAEYFS